MATKKTTGKQLADLMYGNPEGAAFGITPMIGKRREDRQDRESAKNFPVDFGRGVIAGAAGMPGDIESLIRMLPGLDEKTFLPTSEDVLKRIPFGSDSPVGEFASGLGILGGGSLPVGPAIRGAKAVPGALKTAARNVSTPSTLNPQAGVIKMKGGNWLAGNIMGNIDENVKRLKPYTKVGAQADFLQKDLVAYEAALERLKNDKYTLPQTVQAQQDVVDNIKKKIAINNWVESNLGKYVKNQMATPEDPIRLLLDKRTKEIEAKHAKDMERAERMAQRAIDETDPRRQANMIRESERLKMEANVERQFAMDSIIPSRMQDYSPDADQYLKQRRQEAGFPAEGMGESEAAKRYETLTDDAISTMRAGDVQAVAGAMEESKAALQLLRSKEEEIQRKFNEHVLSKGLSEGDLAGLNSMPMKDKAAIIQDPEYQELFSNYSSKSLQTMSPEYVAAQQNPFISKLDPEAQLYSGNTADMGFDHVIDILKQDVMEGRIRPEQLSKVSVEDAVRRTMDFDQEAAKKMAEAQFKATEGFPTYKEYPEGYRWIELAKPSDLTDLPEGYRAEPYKSQYSEGVKIIGPDGKQAAAGDDLEEALRNMSETRLEEALKYEGDTMGHCVGGYCPDVLEGRSRIYSLRDAKGEPHVTVEVEPNQNPYPVSGEAFAMLPQATKAQYGQYVREWRQRNPNITELTDEHTAQALREAGVKPEPDRVIQIKGKQNAAPKDTYLPYVQDFVKSGQYSDVGDISNTGLRNTTDWLNPDTAKAYEKAGLSVPKYATDAEIESLHNQYLRIAEPQNLPPEDGMAHGGPVHFSDNPDVMQLELAGGGLVKRAVKAAAKAVKAGADAPKPLVEAPSIIIPGKVSSVKEAIRQSKGDYGARRVERAADEVKNLERLYKERALIEAFGGDNAKALMTMNPADFENYAVPLQPRFMDKNSTRYTTSGERLDYPEYMSEYLPNVGAFNDVPFLMINKEEQGLPLIPFISGHEGRHRNRVMTGKGENAGLVQLLPRAELREPFPRRHQDEYIEALIEELGLTDNMVLPERYIDDGSDVTIRRPAIKLPDPYAAGGAVHMAGGGALAKVAKALKPAKEAAVPLSLPRVRPSTQEILEAAERVGKQQAGEFVRSPLLKDTTNLAGRSKKEVERLKELEYKVTPIKNLPEVKPYEAQVGEVNIVLPGDQTISDMLLESVDGVPIGTTSEGGALFGRGRLADPEDTRAFWSSNIGPAEQFQKKVTELAELYDTDMVTAYHLAMGQMSNNFAQHMADASMRAIDYSKLNKDKMNAFDRVVSMGYVDPKTKERVTFENWPGIADPEASLQAMKEDPKLRKWFVNRMKTEKVTKPLDLPYGKSIEYAMTEPELRNMEINLTGLSAGRMKPGAELIPDSAHQTYSHDIPGTALGRAPELSPFSISFPDATAFVREKYRPQDFTGTIQKVFPHQVVDEAYLDDMYKYYTQLRKVRGFKKGGEVKSQNNEQQVQNPVHFTENPDAMRLELTKRN
jgi:hypothetical protein